MKKIASEKIKKILDLYTTERIEKTKQRFISLDKNKKPADRYPFCLNFPFFNAYNVSHPAKERLFSYLDAFSFLYQFDDDTIPAIFPGLNHATIPSMFGAKEIRCGIETASEKIIHSNEDAYNLPQPVIAKGCAAHHFLEMDEYFIRQTNGLMPVSVCDMQGPFDACAQMWSYEDMFLAAWEEPEAYHAAMNKITDAFILLWNSQKSTLGEAFLGTHLYSYGWVPQDCGTAVSADSLVMISPEFYKEFYQPYLSKLHNTLGDITIHSCGDFRHLIKDLCDTKGIRAINASQLSIRQLYQAGLDPKIQLLVSLSYDNLESEIAFIKEHSLNVRMVIYGVFPAIENPLAWSEKEIFETKEKIKRIQNLLAV